jgi:hypothetical protein
LIDAVAIDDTQCQFWKLQPRWLGSGELVNWRCSRMNAERCFRELGDPGTRLCWQHAQGNEYFERLDWCASCDRLCREGPNSERLYRFEYRPFWVCWPCEKRIRGTEMHRGDIRQCAMCKRIDLEDRVRRWKYPHNLAAPFARGLRGRAEDLFECFLGAREPHCLPCWRKRYAQMRLSSDLMANITLINSITKEIQHGRKNRNHGRTARVSG